MQRKKKREMSTEKAFDIKQQQKERRGGKERKNNSNNLPVGSHSETSLVAVTGKERNILPMPLSEQYDRT